VKLQARIGVSRAGDWKHIHIPSLRDDQTVGWLPSWLVRIDPAREVCRVNGVQLYADSGASSTRKVPKRFTQAGIQAYRATY